MFLKISSVKKMIYCSNCEEQLGKRGYKEAMYGVFDEDLELATSFTEIIK